MSRIIKNNFEDIVIDNIDVLLKYNRNKINFKDISILLIDMTDKPTLKDKFLFLNKHFKINDFINELKDQKYKCSICNKHLLLKNKDTHDTTQTHLTNYIKTTYLFSN